MRTARQSVVSEAEFLSLPESVEHIEFLDGEVILSPAPSPWHQELLRRIVYALGTWADGLNRPVFIGQAPLDVRFAPNRILQPDAFVILGAVDFHQTGPIDRVPELCVEVLATDRKYDRLTKRFVYAAAGVREYWLVEASGFVERWTGPDLSQAEAVSGHLASALLPGFDLDLDKLFQR